MSRRHGEPSLRLVLAGDPTSDDREAIRALVELREALRDDLREANSGEASHLRREISALSWALRLVNGLKMLNERRAMEEQDFREVERERDARLADEAGEASAPPDHDHEEENDEPGHGAVQAAS